MAALPSVAVLIIFFASAIAFLIASLYIERRRRRRRESATEYLLPRPEPTAETAHTPSPDAGDGAENQRGEDGRKKKRGRKKRAGTRPDGGEDASGFCLSEEGSAGFPYPFFPYPFSSYASATQKKIKMQYDLLVKSNQAKALTMTQVGQFVNCLVEARKQLQQKSEIIQRSFKIRKALLFKANRSSFDRLCHQIYKLEAEHKRLEEDATVYNLLQEQLKLSPAYKTMLEVDASPELSEAAEQAMEFSEISFEELLAQEKKDSFWQRNGRLRSIAS